MNLMSYRDAREKYFDEGMDELFTFDEYIDYLRTCHIIVARNG